MKKITRSVLLMTALFINASIALAADLLDTASRDGMFRKFMTALQQANVAAPLKHDGSYTFFAPTNEAISKISELEWTALTQDPQKLTVILKGHLIPGKKLVSEIKPGTIRTLAGSEVHISSDNGMVSIEDAHVTQSDLEADNGVIHAIDRLVLPDSLVIDR